MREDWVRATQGTTKVFLNLATATRMRPGNEGGTIVCWQKGSDTDNVTVKETAEDLIKQLASSTQT